MNKPALKESLSDTVFGTFINFPVNFILIAFCLEMEMQALTMTVFMTACLFVLAVVRKYFVRTYFEKRNSL
jgi:hypothetical protein|tara:strand:- start:3003 stop:3215 length:213 start_codon:yes stop_codon:yes gene_type:complete